MVNEGLWIGLEMANTPASHLRSAARAVDHLHRAFDVIQDVDATSALCEFSRMRREGQLYNSHEAFVNEVPCMPSSGFRQRSAMYAEPDLVEVQISTNGCVGGNGPDAIEKRLFQLN